MTSNNSQCDDKTIALSSKSLCCEEKSKEVRDVFLTFDSKLGDNDLVFSDFWHVIENLHAWKLGVFMHVYSWLHVENLKILHRYPHSKSITQKLFYSIGFDELFKIATAASLRGMFIVASSYLVKAF